jgi:hypothetical protein
VDDSLTVKADEGFLPLLSDEFRATYGANSFFVLATADVFTTALAHLMERAGRLPRPDTVAIVGQQAREALAVLVAATDAQEALLEEALGLAAPGMLRQAVDAVLSVGAFAYWLRPSRAGISPLRPPVSSGRHQRRDFHGVAGFGSPRRHGEVRGKTAVIIQGDAKEALDLRRVQVQRDDTISAGHLDRIGTDPSTDGDPGFILLVALRITEVGHDDRHRLCAGASQRIEPPRAARPGTRRSCA